MLPKRLRAICCHHCKHHIFRQDGANIHSHCLKHEFDFDWMTNRFSSLFNRCENFENRFEDEDDYPKP